MKSYNHLWEKYISDENIKLAINNASLGKRDRNDVKDIFENPEKYISEIREYATHFYNKRHKPKTINDGITQKKRTIIVPSFMEQIIHHMIVNVMLPMFNKGMYEHSYASIPGRGSHKGMKRIKKWIAKDPKNVKFCFKMDIRKFFDSIPHDKLKAKLEKTIHDKRFLEVLFTLIDVTDVGLPLGFYTSQWLANWYLQGLDHHIKEDLGAIYYIRYMDDIVVFGSNKRKLHRIHKGIECYLSEELGLSIKNNWQVYRFDYIRGGKHFGRCLDFMGFKFYRDRVTLRRNIMLKATRKAKKLSHKEKPSIYDIRQMLSYIGWIDHTNTYGMYQQRIKPYVDIGKLKKRISSYDRKQNQLKGVA